MIYGIANLAAIVIFLSLTALPFYLLFLLGRTLGRRASLPAIKWLLPLAAIALVTAWAVASVRTFQRACDAHLGREAALAYRGQAKGLVVRDATRTFPPRAGFDWQPVLETRTVEFVDIDRQRMCSGDKQHPRLPYSIQRSCDMSPRPELVVQVHPIRPVQHWWHPPIFEVSTDVTEVVSGPVLARATDIVFGGGLVGKYMRLFGGDQDYEFLSCGYASKNIGPWRPSLASHPRFGQYREADLALIKAVVDGQ